jgi:hypothetical protein
MQRAWRGELPGRFAINELAMAVEKRPLLRLDGEPYQAVGQPHIGKLPHCMRQQIDTNAERTVFGCRFNDPAWDSAPVQRQGQCEPTDPPAYDYDHGSLDN